MVKPEVQYSKSIEHTLDQLSEEETTDMVKALKRGSIWSC